jgi:dephospho-CoA kinase
VNKQVQQKRLQARDDISPEQQKQRMESQMGNEKKNQKADFVIDNNGSREKLVGQLERLELLLKDIPRKPVDRLTDI